jgi:predicted ferric reductase
LGLYTSFWDFLINNQGEYYATLLMIMIAFNIILSCRLSFFKNILKIPYHIWKYGHRFMVLLFLIGIYHSVGVKTFTFSNPTLSIYMYIVYILGISAFIYKAFFYDKLKNKYKYQIENIKDFGDTIEITMSPQSHLFIKNKAGQFAFFKFLEKGIGEIHPFTISNLIKDDKKIRLSIKSLGDWTSKLKSNIKIGTNILVDGPYGKFNSEKENNNTEIWIAGGIGITPFLAFLEDYKLNNNPNKKIIFVWSVKDEKEAIYKEEIEKDLPNNISFILHDTSKSGFFKFENLKDKFNISENPKVYICGPIAMRESVMENAEELGIKDFHFEEFSFR